MSVFEQFEKIKAAGFPPILVISGEALDIIQELKQKIFAAISFDADNMSQSYFDLVDTDGDVALEELESLPFFDDKRLVILENLWNLTAAKKSVFDEKQLIRFERFLDSPVETTQLILIVNGKLDARLKLVKKLKKAAVLLDAVELTEAELFAYFSAASHSTFARPVLGRLFQKSNFKFSTIAQNIELVTTYVNGRAATLEDVEKIVPRSLDDNVFQLSEFIFAKKPEAASRLISDLVLQGEELIKILAVLTASYRLYYQVKLMQSKGLPETQMVSNLKIHPYRVKLANQAVRRLDKNYLSQSLIHLIKLDDQLKTSVADKTLLMDVTLVKLSTGLV